MLDRGFCVCGLYHVVMQLDRVYVRRLVVMLVVRTLHAPLLARYLSIVRHHVSISAQLYCFRSSCAKLVKGWNPAHCVHGRTVWVDTCLKHDAHGISVRIPISCSFRRAHRGSCELPQACHLQEVFQWQSCHGPLFYMVLNDESSSLVFQT